MDYGIVGSVGLGRELTNILTELQVYQNTILKIFKKI